MVIYSYCFCLTPNRSSAGKSAPSALSITQISAASRWQFIFREIKVNFWSRIHFDALHCSPRVANIYTNIQKNLFGSSTDNKCSRFHRGDQRPHSKIVSTLKDWQLDQHFAATAKSKFRVQIILETELSLLMSWTQQIDGIYIDWCVFHKVSGRNRIPPLANWLKSTHWSFYNQARLSL